MQSDDNGQGVLICGGTAGIGLASARLLLARGCRVVIVGRSPERGQAALREIGPDRASFIACDTADPGQCSAMIDTAAEQLGGIDALISCAGGNPRPRLLKNIPCDDLLPTIHRSLAPTILPTHAILPHMSERARGAIVCVASDAGKLSTPGETAIGAAMAGIMMYCRAMAEEVKRNGIRVNCVTPSIVEGTELHDDLMADEFAGKLFAKAKSRAALGVAQASDVAAMIAFLIGPESSRVTGQTISVTGGISTI
jgi:2-hydroxycyclohexanecarboxyl-CoA dehydrogenase